MLLILKQGEQSPFKPTIMKKINQIKVGDYINVKGIGTRKIIAIRKSWTDELLFAIYLHKSSTRTLTTIGIENIILN